MVSLEVQLSSLKLRNPTLLASGIYGFTLPLLKRAYDEGAGAVVSKSLGLSAREGYRNPTIVRLEVGYINAIGLANPGYEEFYKELLSFNQDFDLIVSLFSDGEEGFVKMVKKFDNTFIKAFELNLSCPHVNKVGSEIGEDEEMVYKIVKACKGVTRKPLFVKLPPLPSSQLIKVALAARDAEADGITATNTIKALAIDPEIGKPILSNVYGGLSGKALKPIALRCVYELYEKLDIPIIGCGGIEDWRDAVEFILAGARAIQIGTAIAYKDIKVFRDICEGLTLYLERKGYKELENLVGRAHR
ncbi:Dihydroorotate dehydrogenase B (NAD(+)), catalytic subunit [archaeon HR06]|nr:Dihydroorotate dehydrogenase B (NAD(+)), catalytic subunit [archaeon HR06]